MTRLSPAKSVAATAAQDDYIGSPPAFREQMAGMQRILPVQLSDNGIMRNTAGQRAMEAADNA